MQRPLTNSPADETDTGLVWVVRQSQRVRQCAFVIIAQRTYEYGFLPPPPLEESYIHVVLVLVRSTRDNLGRGTSFNSPAIGWHSSTSFVG